jgi:hypothetical protein
MTMTTKKPEPVVVDDLRSLRAALDAPARERAAAEAREQEGEQRTRQDGALTYARKIAEKLETAVAASAAWDATPVDVQQLVRTFGADTPLLRAYDAVNSGSHPIADAARTAGEVAALVKELERPTLLPAGRLEAILKALEHAAGRADGFLGVYAGSIRVREDAVAQLVPVLKLHYALRRRWTPTEAERALLARWQQRLADAAAAEARRPYTPPPARRIPGANFDAVQPAPSVRRPLVGNMEDIE